MNLQEIQSISKSRLLFDLSKFKEEKFNIEILKDKLKEFGAKFPMWSILTLVLDEAKLLLEKISVYDTCFQFVRRALREIDLAIVGFPRIFVVLADTSSKVSNFSPPGKLDSSTRKYKPADKPLLLHHPYFELNNTDIHLMKIRDEIKKGKKQKFTELEYFKYEIFLRWAVLSGILFWEGAVINTIEWMTLFVLQRKSCCVWRHRN
jgi:hypothetical protein